MMKNPEEYIIETEKDHWADQEFNKDDITKWIKQAQIDAYNEALDDAVENADFGVNQNDNGCPCFNDDHFIDNQSILKLKK